MLSGTSWEVVAVSSTLHRFTIRWQIKGIPKRYESLYWMEIYFRCIRLCWCVSSDDFNRCLRKINSTQQDFIPGLVHRSRKPMYTTSLLQKIHNKNVNKSNVNQNEKHLLQPHRNNNKKYRYSQHGNRVGKWNQQSHKYNKT